VTDPNADQRLLRTVLDYGGVAIEVGVHRPADLEWVEDFLAPAFSVSERETVDVRVQFDVDPERFEALVRRGPAAAGDVVDGLVLEGSTHRFRPWADAAESPGRGGDGAGAKAVRTAFDPGFDVFYEVMPGPSVRITARSGVRCRVPLMRVVREFAMHACLRSGDLFLHAAALRVGERAIVIAGASASGKTTTLTWSLQLLEDARFISNDRVRVRPSAAGYDVIGMPTVMAFRPHGLELVPEFDAALRAERGSPHLSRTEVRGRDDLPLRQPRSDGRFGMSPSRYAELLGRRSAASAPAGAIVFPEVVADDGGLRAVPIDPASAGARLEQAIFGLAGARRSELFDLPAVGPYPSEDQLREHARRIAAAVPCYVWQVGANAPHDFESLRRFVREVSGGGSSRAMPGVR
jgi:hypothetical protein